MNNEEQNNKVKVKVRKLFEFLKEIRQYKHEVAMQKLNEEFALKQHENEMEFCKEILEKYENGTLWEELE